MSAWNACLFGYGKRRLAGKSLLWQDWYRAWEQQRWRPAPLLDLLNYGQHQACVGDNQSIGHLPKTFFYRASSLTTINCLQKQTYPTILSSFVFNSRLTIIRLWAVQAFLWSCKRDTGDIVQTRISTGRRRGFFGARDLDDGNIV